MMYPLHGYHIIFNHTAYGNCVVVAKMASHAIFQYNVLVIDDTHNTWTNMIVKMNIPRLLGSSDDKVKIGIARPEGPPLRGFCYPVSRRGSRGSRPSRVSGRCPESSSVQRTRIEETVKKSKSKKSRQRYFSSTGRTDAIGIGASDGCRMIRWPGF